jgi:hypothetical protein
MDYQQAFKGNLRTLYMLQIGKIKMNIRNLLVFKGKDPNIKLTTDSNNKNNLPNNAFDAVPSLDDMEFTWTNDY